VRALGCTQMQGFLFSAARPPKEIRTMLGSGDADTGDEGYAAG
jgi:EAL domain-containing protein (putative c-di-GMP-specific phosphodiesterase class I)